MAFVVCQRVDGFVRSSCCAQLAPAYFPRANAKQLQARRAHNAHKVYDRVCVDRRSSQVFWGALDGMLRITARSGFKESSRTLRMTGRAPARSADLLTRAVKHFSASSGELFGCAARRIARFKATHDAHPKPSKCPRTIRGGRASRRATAQSRSDGASYSRNLQSRFQGAM
jgi:hypothetical protein